MPVLALWTLLRNESSSWSSGIEGWAKSSSHRAECASRRLWSKNKNDWSERCVRKVSKSFSNRHGTRVSPPSSLEAKNKQLDEEEEDRDGAGVSRRF